MLIRRFVRRMGVATGALGLIMALALGITWAVSGVGSIEVSLEPWVAIAGYLAVAAVICWDSREEDRVQGFKRRHCKSAAAARSMAYIDKEYRTKGGND